jgi:hypothetical protein
MSADQSGAASESGEPAPSQTAEDIVAQVESGPRSPRNRIAVWVIIVISVAWSVFQLYIAQSPINSFIARSWHLGFALALVYLAYPAYDFHNPPRWIRGLRAVLPFLKTARSNREYIPLIDILLAIVATGGALFIWWDFQGIINRQGLPSQRDVWMGVITMVLLLEAARRALGPALSIICIVFIVYAFVGPWMPDILRHRGIPLDFFINDMYMSTTGIFGVPLGVSTSFVFLFVLFGALLDKAGAGKYFIDVAFAGLGHKTGGPAKAAVVASGLSGLVSGSSIANVVTTGTFTIPLMKKVGLPAYKAGAIEVAASTNGQLMPPIMGAAAFIMADIIGIPYLDVVRAALFPAIISYMALFYVVHLEALKLNLRPLSKSELPPLLKTFLNGLHYLVPLIVLIWFLVIVRFSPITSALFAIESLAVIMIIQRPIIAYVALGAQKKAGNNRGGRHHRRRRHQHRPGRPLRAADRRGLVRQRHDHADPDGGHQHDPRHGPADDGQLHSDGDPDGAGDRRAGRQCRADLPAHRGTPVRVLFRYSCRRHPAGRPGRLCRRGDRPLGPDQDRHPGLHLRPAHRDPAVCLHLQHRIADDLRRRRQWRHHLAQQYIPAGLGVRCFIVRDVCLRRFHAGLLRRRLLLAGTPDIAGRVHPDVPAVAGVRRHRRAAPTGPGGGAGPLLRAVFLSEAPAKTAAARRSGGADRVNGAG